jgi:hypothetical protein
MLTNRRAFVTALGAGAAALVVGACDDEGGTDGTGPGTGGSGTGGSGSGSANGPASDASGTGGASPTEGIAWKQIPTIQFTEGVAASFSIAAFLVDPEGAVATLMKNDVVLPPGVTFDGTAMQFIYDGVGAAATTEGHVLTADDGAG